MPEPCQRKETAFATSQTRSVFFTGEPNREKLELLAGIQTSYTSAVNRFIGLIDSSQDVLLPVLKNDKHDGSLRRLEKEHRDPSLGCALSQAAFDDAVTMLSNRMKLILQKMRSECYDLFTESKVLFCMAVRGASREDMAEAMTCLAESVKRGKKYYQDAAARLQNMSGDAFSLRMEEFALSYFDASSVFRVPHARKMWVRASSKACVLEKAVTVSTSHVFTAVNPACHGQRISVPVRTSRNSLRRMEQYGCAKSCSYTVLPNGKLRISVAFEKHVEQPATTAAVGVDTGIIDCLYTSDGKHFGTFKESEDYYKKVVEPAFGELAALRSKKQKILHYVNSHRDLPPGVRRSLLDRADLLESMAQKAKQPYHLLRNYHQRQEAEIAGTVNAYISSIDRSTLTVLEKLDIREFNRGRAANGRLSMFARGQLQHRLMAELNWHGYDFAEVDPAYTSQLCPVCSHIDRANRNGKQFRCTCCGCEQDADFNAAGNIRARVDDEEVRKACEDHQYNTKDRHSALRKIYRDRHREWERSDKTEGRKPAAPRQQADCSI